MSPLPQFCGGVVWLGAVNSWATVCVMWLSLVYWSKREGYNQAIQKRVSEKPSAVFLRNWSISAGFCGKLENVSAESLDARQSWTDFGARVVVTPVAKTEMFTFSLKTDFIKFV